MITSAWLKQDLLAECVDDHVSLSTVIGYVEDEASEGASPYDTRQATIEVVQELRPSGKVQAGFPDSHGRGFHAWPFQAADVVAHIESRWKPNIRP